MGLGAAARTPRAVQGSKRKQFQDGNVDGVQEPAKKQPRDEANGAPKPPATMHTAEMEVTKEEVAVTSKPKVRSPVRLVLRHSLLKKSEFAKNASPGKILLGQTKKILAEKRNTCILALNRASGFLNSVAAKASVQKASLLLSLQYHYQRHRIYMHWADEAVDGVLSPAFDRANKRLRKVKARLGIGPPVPKRWGEEGCRGMSNFHRAPVKGFVMPADVMAYRSGGDPTLALNLPRMLNSRRGDFKFVPGSLPAIAEE